MCDRILVMHRGRSMGIVDRAHADQEMLMARAMGLAPSNPEAR
jgi:ABC-type sugar transport system ATPase subunit